MSVLRFLLQAIAVTTLVGCLGGPPKGVTAFVIEDQTEFAAAMLLYPKSEEFRLPLKLKYVDTNTFQTTATLAPGYYTLVLRTEQGRFLKTPVEIEPGKQLYRVSLLPIETDEATFRGDRLPRFRGKVYVSEGKLPSELVVVFVGRDVVVRRTAVAADGNFEIEVPKSGTYWIELFSLGDSPAKWERGKVDLTKDVDVGLVALRPLR